MMKSGIQIDKSNYEFSRYMSKGRWCSLWHQVDEVHNLKPKRVLEVGPGPGLFKIIASTIGISVETLDFDPSLNPDHVGLANDLPFEDCAYDVVCAFQMLEHLPYENSLKAFEEMVRVARRHVVISLPDARAVWHYQIHIPRVGPCDFFLPRPRLKAPKHEFDGEHYWEINKQGFLLSKVISDFTEYAQLVKTYRVPENPWHRFFVFVR
jgi:SAM-dependent methyltransferase